VFGKLLRSCHQHSQLEQLFQPIEVSEMFVRDGEGVKRSHESRFPTLLNLKVVTQSAGNGEFSVGNRKHATEEKQIPDIRGLNVSTQWGLVYMRSSFLL
jgi:hypothetical protein